MLEEDPKIRNIVRPHLKHMIGNGEKTYLWYDNWHPGVPLVEKYGPRAVNFFLVKREILLFERE